MTDTFRCKRFQDIAAAMIVDRILNIFDMAGQIYDIDLWIEFLKGSPDIKATFAGKLDVEEGNCNGIHPDKVQRFPSVRKSEYLGSG